MELITIGVDPGPHTGICVLGAGRGLVVECDGESALILIRDLLRSYEKVRIATEQYVIGPGSRKAGKAGTETMRIVGELAGLREPGRVGIVTRSAGVVKPWATDRRLKAAGLLERTVGRGHARDGARHALYSDVWDSGRRDPLAVK